LVRLEIGPALGIEKPPQNAPGILTGGSVLSFQGDSLIQQLCGAVFMFVLRLSTTLLKAAG
jgi:hypothetical protein